MRTLLDTNVVSELRRPQPDPRVFARVEAMDPDDLFLASVTFGELTHGVRRMDAGRRRDGLQAWLDRLEAAYGDRILPFDRDAARIWGDLLARCAASGRTLPLEDAQIAAIALRFDLTLMTRNVRNFEGTGVRVVDPWDAT